MHDEARFRGQQLHHTVHSGVVDIHPLVLVGGGEQRPGAVLRQTVQPRVRVGGRVRVRVRKILVGTG